MSPRAAADLEWPLSEGMQVSVLPSVWIAMIISCWSVKLLKLPSVTLTHVCCTNSHNWWAKGLPGVGAVKIFYDSDSSGWKSFRLLDSYSTALLVKHSQSGSNWAFQCLQPVHLGVGGKLTLHCCVSSHIFRTEKAFQHIKLTHLRMHFASGSLLFKYKQSLALDVPFQNSRKVISLR